MRRRQALALLVALIALVPQLLRDSIIRASVRSIVLARRQGAPRWIVRWLARAGALALATSPRWRAS